MPANARWRASESKRAEHWAALAEIDAEAEYVQRGLAFVPAMGSDLSEVKGAKTLIWP